MGLAPGSFAFRTASASSSGPRPFQLEVMGQKQAGQVAVFQPLRQRESGLVTSPRSSESSRLVVDRVRNHGDPVRGHAVVVFEVLLHHPAHRDVPAARDGRIAAFSIDR